MRIWCLKLEPNGRFKRASSNDGLICPTIEAWREADPAASEQHLMLVAERQRVLQERFMATTGLAHSDAVAATVANIIQTTGDHHGSTHR